jgi:hypothetical protein
MVGGEEVELDGVADVGEGDIWLESVAGLLVLDGVA